METLFVIFFRLESGEKIILSRVFCSAFPPPTPRPPTVCWKKPAFSREDLVLTSRRYRVLFFWNIVRDVFSFWLLVVV